MAYARRALTQVAVKPFRRELRHLLERTFLLEKVRGARDNSQFFLAVKRRQSFHIKSDDEFIEFSDINDELKRRAKWTEGIAVGNQAFVKQIEERIRGRQDMEISHETVAWVLREEYRSIFDAKNAPIRRF